jgi:hypothetical protein
MAPSLPVVADSQPASPLVDPKFATATRAEPVSVLRLPLLLAGLLIGPAVLTNRELLASAWTRVEQALECIGDHKKLSIDHHAEIAAALGIYVCFFGIVGSWAGVHCRRLNKSAEYTARVNSYVHAVGSSILCFLVLLNRYMHDDPWSAPTSTQEGFALSFSVAYFFVDTIAILTGDFFDGIFLLHHAACITGISWTILSGEAGHFVTLVVGCMEVTNPFMHAHWLNVADKRVSGYWYNANRFGFIAAFTFVRGIVGPWLIYTAYHIPTMPWSMVGIGAAFFIFSMRALIPIIQSEIKGEIWVS